VGAWVSVAEVKARIPAATYTAVFDKDRTNDSPTTDAFCALCLTDAQSIAQMRLGGAFPVPLDEGGAVVDVQIKSAVIALALWVAVKHTALATNDPKSAYRTAITGPMGVPDGMKTDRDRPANSPGGRARPRARTSNLVDGDGVSTQAFGRARDRKDGSDF